MDELNKFLREKVKRINITYIATYVPRKCGIATYTRDLNEAVKFINPYSQTKIFALVKPDETIDYPPEVKFKINQHDINAYKSAANRINKSKADIVMLQHEFGLYGGQYGEHIIELLKALKKPLVITLHTIPDDPQKGYGRALKDLIKFAEKIVVMMPQSLEKLVRDYGSSKEKIEIIPHGVPDIPFESNARHKKKKGLEGRRIIGNINLLSRVKGQEYILEALKSIKEEFPDIMYLIIGQTHPVVLQTEGEEYRNSLKEKIKLFKLTENVKFVNKYLSLENLIEWLKTIDIYITPYLDPQQSASGALAYAIGAGKVCISTPYLYAKDVLAYRRGIIVPFKNSRAIAKTVIDLFKNPEKKAAIKKRAYNFGRTMTWHNVALQHLKLFEEILKNKQSAGF